MDEKYIGIEILKTMEKAVVYNDSLAELATKYINNKDFVLDFGAGIGTISNILRNKGYNVSCLETNVEETNILKEKGYTVFSDVCKISDNSVDCIVSYNVFEHINDDKTTMKQLHRILKKNGILFVFVPAIQKLYSSFDKRLGHIRRYEKKDFINLLNYAGFEIKEWSFFDSLGYFTALIYKLFNKSGELTDNQVIYYDKFVFPLSKLLDNFLNRKIGKNIYAVAYKA